MSLYFINTHSYHPTVARSVDDLHIRGPILLAPHQVNPLVEMIESHYLGPTWRLATTGRDELLQGTRFENAVWRRWGQQLFGVARVERAERFIPIMLEGRTWREKELLVPIVVSQETFHNRHELSFVQPTIDECSSPLANGTPPLPRVAVGSQDILLLRPCLKRGTSSVYGSDSPLSLRSSLPSSSPTAMSPSTRRVLFNACVERSEIAAAPLQYNDEDDNEGSMLGLIFNDDQYQDVYSLGSVLYQFQPRLQQSVLEGDSSDDDDEFYPLLPTTLLDRSEAIVLALHPGQIAPLSCSESDSKVRFVAPKWMADLDEDELRPYQARPLRRRVRILDLSQVVFPEAEEKEKEQEQEIEFEEPRRTSVNGLEGGLQKVAGGDTLFTGGWLPNGGSALAEGEFGEWEKEDEREEIDGEIYYDCQEGYDWDDGYDCDEDSGGEEVDSSDGVELVGMIANSLSSFFW